MSDSIIFRYDLGGRKGHIKKSLPALFIIAAIILYEVFTFDLPRDMPKSLMGIISSCIGSLDFLITIVIVILISLYAIPLLDPRREFSIIITRERLTCKMPAKIFGESFSTPITDIDTILEETTYGIFPKPKGWWAHMTKKRYLVNSKKKHVNVPDADSINTRWYIITKQKEKVEIKSTFHTPVEEIVTILQQQNPNIKIEKNV